MQNGMLVAPVTERPKMRTIIFSGNKRPEIVVYKDLSGYGFLPGTAADKARFANCALHPTVAEWVQVNMSPDTIIQPGFDVLYIQFASDRDYVLFKTFWL